MVCESISIPHMGTQKKVENHTHTHTYVYMHTFTCRTCKCSNTHSHLYTKTHTCKYVHTFIQTRTHTVDDGQSWKRAQHQKKQQLYDAASTHGIVQLKKKRTGKRQEKTRKKRQVQGKDMLEQDERDAMTTATLTVLMYQSKISFSFVRLEYRSSQYSEEW